jgi:hypothetical protein
MTANRLLGFRWNMVISNNTNPLSGKSINGCITELIDLLPAENTEKIN